MSTLSHAGFVFFILAVAYQSIKLISHRINTFVTNIIPVHQAQQLTNFLFKFRLFGSYCSLSASAPVIGGGSTYRHLYLIMFVIFFSLSVSRVYCPILLMVKASLDAVSRSICLPDNRKTLSLQQSRKKMVSTCLFKPSIRSLSPCSRSSE